jgi:hypothetical protein
MSLGLRLAPRAAIGAIALVSPLPAWACATCGCTLSADAAMGYSATSGWRLNLEYDYINQDELRSGTHIANGAQVVNQPSDPTLGGGEIEHATLNRYFTIGLTYSPSAAWHFDLRVPYIERDHSTFGQQQQPYTPSETAPDQLSSARVSGLGDARLIATYQGFLPTHNFGVQLGVKLPTGGYGTRVDFASGPAAGSALDASLQAGTGSTDVIVGTYYYQPISQDFDAFINGQFQSAVTHAPSQPGGDYRPGNSATVSFGLRYENNPRWIPGLQVNVLHRAADQGALADTTDTAGTVAYLSPGLTVRAGRRLHVYGFVQVPIYSNLDGYQLFPHWTASAGLSYAF